jgi:hypothetical protein
MFVASSRMQVDSSQLLPLCFFCSEANIVRCTQEEQGWS